MEGMNGQWLGRYASSGSGTLIIELDDMGTHYEGRTFAYDDNQAMPSTFALIKTANKEPTLHLDILPYPIDHRTGNPTTWNELAALFPGIVFPTTASVDLNFLDTTLKVSWSTNIGTSGSAEITRKRADDPTDYQPLTEVTKWEEFKSYVCNLEHRRYIFRGQSKLLRLRITFHRTGRADLARFLEVDMKTLHRHLSLRTSHVFNRDMPDENGAFFNLVQHHGYPTPLLDWTSSPFVPAFFAYPRLKNTEAVLADAEEKVRILQFDQKVWRAKFPQIHQLTGLNHTSQYWNS